jgi:NADPH-dependent curcumin reductase CurA
MSLSFQNVATVAAVAVVAVASLLSRSSKLKKGGMPFSSYRTVAKSLILLSPFDEGLPSEKLGVHFDVKEEPLEIGEGGRTLQSGEVLVKLLCLSADPYQRGRVKSVNPLGSDGQGEEKEAKVMRGFVCGKILASNHSEWQVGDLLGGSLGYTSVQVINVEKEFVWKLTGYVDETTISYGIGALGMPGATAYGGLIDVLRPKTGETLWVSAASGAVGSLVGQIGKNVYGLKVIGSVGGQAKVKKILESYGYDAAIDRKTLPPKESNGSWVARKEELKRRIKEAAPEGIDMYFENVGEDHFEAAFESLKAHGRIAVCGQIAAYNDKVPSTVNVYPGKMIYSFQRIEGFICVPWLTRKKGNFFQDMSQWIKDGKVEVKETKFSNVSSWPLAFRSLFVNTDTKDGKVVVLLGQDDWGKEVTE